jgi:hypothetical protein
MLQIISGKFFGDGELYEFEGRGILYSNMSWFRAIETRVASLEPVDTAGSEVSSYVLSYLNQIEKEPAGGTVRVGDPQIVEQFAWLCMVWFEAFFDADKQNVVVNCREKPAHAGDHYVGAKFARPYLSPERRITEEDEQRFISFVDQVIGLPRQDYLVVMSFLQTISHALHALRQNLDLAYSMLVYALESLSQGRSGYLPRWEDYDHRVRTRLDPILDELAPETAGTIRDALLEDDHLKLQQRFVDFTVSHIPDSFFIEDAERVERPVRRSELERALKNAYRARSSYVHELLPLIHQLKTSGIADGELFEWDNKPYLTFNGLLRIARAVVLDFVRKQPYLEEEEYDWVSEFPGHVMMKLAGQYWIGRHEGFSPNQSASWLSAFLPVWLETYSSKESVMPDLRPLLAKFESLFGSASATQRAQMLAIHVLYNHLMASEWQSPDHEAVHEANESVFDECRIESMALKVIMGVEWPRSADDCGQAYDAYAQTKFYKGGLLLPWAVEVAMMAYIAAKYREDDQDDAFTRWCWRALLESAGEAAWQNHIRAVQGRGETWIWEFSSARGKKQRSIRALRRDSYRKGAVRTERLLLRTA